MEFQAIVEGRRSVKKYDSNHKISDEELKRIFEKVVLSPSSFNLQHWRFVVIRDEAHKKELRKAAYDQEQVETCSAAIVVVGKLTAFRDAERIYAEAPQGVRESMVPMIHGFYEDKPQMRRDEALRSCGLAAMTLMYAAYEAGYATGPMIGFDPEAVGKLVGLDSDHFPAMLVVLGKQVGDMRPRAMRWPPSEAVRCERLDGPGLGQ